MTFLTSLSQRHRQSARICLIVLASLLLVGTISIAQENAATSLPSQDRPLRTLRDLNRAFIDIASAVKPTVVTVSTERVLTAPGSPFGSPFANDPFWEFFFGPQQRQQEPQDRQYRQQGLGSGVIVSKDGQILTNNHVVAEADSIFVHTFDGRRFTAKVIGVDPKTDIAVLKIDAADLAYIQIGNSDDLQVGEMVMAIGSPMSENLAYTVTQGIVSAKGRSNVGLADYEDFIQTDAAINPGNSGGPLVNLDGQLVGLNAAIVSRTGGFQGIGFAVPSNMAIHVMKSLLAQGKVVRGWLGVSIQDVSEEIAHAMELNEPTGALVGDVVPDGPADKAGVQPGDLIVEIDGKPVGNSAQLRYQIASTDPDASVTLGILRDGQKQSLRVTLVEMPAEYAQTTAPGGMSETLGFSVATLTRELADRYGIDPELNGAVVTAIDAQSQASQAGLREGDLIRAVDRQRVQSKEQFDDRMTGKKKGDSVLLRVNREGSGFFIAFTL
jgi:serine protease Do